MAKKQVKKKRAWPKRAAIVAAVQMFDLLGSGLHQNRLPGQGPNPVLEDLVQSGFSALPVGSLVGHKTWPGSALQYGTGLDTCSRVHASRVPKVAPPQAPPPNTFIKATASKSGDKRPGNARLTHQKHAFGFSGSFLESVIY